ncbi:hypothetical protein, partial [Dolosigranulum pigrum]|uniref:hypothetical protein n=1 Tax=Dolosigranulum pigrum TaxID=29394 RepID=UPI000DBFE0BA
EIKTEIKSVEDKLQNASDEQKVELEQKLGTLQANIEAEKARIDDLAQRVSQNETDIEGIQENLDNLNEQAADLEQSIKVVETNVSELDKALVTEINDRKQAVEEIKTEIKSVEDKLQNASDEQKVEFEQKLGTLQANIEVEKARIDDLAQRVGTNEENINQLAKTSVGLINEAEKLNNLINDLEIKASDLDTSIRKEIEDRKQAIENVKSQLEDAKQELENNANANKQELEEKLNNLSNELNTEKDKLNDLTGRVGINEENINQLAKTSIGLINEAEKLNNLINDLEIKASDLDASIQKEIEDRKQAIENVKSQLEERLTNEVNRLDGRIDKEIEERIKDVNGLQTTIDTLTEQQDKLSDELNQHIQDTQTELNQLKDKLSSVETMTKDELANVNNRIDELTRYVVELEDEVHAQLEIIGSVLNTHTEQIAQNEQDLRNVEKEIESLKETDKQLDEKINSVRETLRRVRRELSGRQDELEKELARQDKLNQQQNNAITDLSGKTNELQNKVTDLEKEIERLAQSAEKEPEQEQQQGQEQQQEQHKHGGGLAQPEKPAFTGEVDDYQEDNFGELNVSPSDETDLSWNAIADEAGDLPSEKPTEEIEEQSSYGKGLVQPEKSAFTGEVDDYQEDNFGELNVSPSDETDLSWGAIADEAGELPDKETESNYGMGLINEKPEFPQDELDKLVAIERSKYADAIRALLNLTQAQKDQLTAELEEAGTVPAFDTILDIAQALNAAQVSEEEKPEIGGVDEDSSDETEGEQPSEENPSVDDDTEAKPDKGEEPKPEFDADKDSKPEISSEVDMGEQSNSKPEMTQPPVTQAGLSGSISQAQGERLPATATGAWMLGFIGVSTLLVGTGIRKKDEEDKV